MRLRIVRSQRNCLVIGLQCELESCEPHERRRAVDIRLGSLRLQGDWLHTSFFNQSQNNFVLVGGIVVHF